MSLSRKLLAVPLAAALAFGGLVGYAEPAAAASWRLINIHDRGCVSYSYGTYCTVDYTWLRDVSYCTKPPIKNPYASMAWASYCLKYTSVTKRA